MYTLHFGVYIYEIFIDRYTLKMLGFNPTVGQIWTNPNAAFKMS